MTTIIETTNQDAAMDNNASSSGMSVIAKRAVWDLALSPQEFLMILHGELEVSWPSRAFCVARLLECCNWYDAVKILPPRDICALWPEARRYVRSHTIKLGMEYACRILQ